MVIKSAILYETECETIKCEKKNKLQMSEHTKQYKIRNECIRKEIGVAPIVEKMRRLVESPIRKVDQMEASSIHRGRRRPRKTIDKEKLRTQ
ncbi:hypothetical protein Lal_00042950 [Lupinus albus]|nr:hypothetical protein Lal_00042950 [Lupinus albus]